MKRERTNHVKDVRGRRVSQLDPVALQLLRRQEPIDADTLEAITSEKGVRITTLERGALILGILSMLALLGFAAALLVQGTSWGGIARRLGPTTYLFVWPFIVWGTLKRRRWGKIPAAMLKHSRCPHCGYDLRGLPLTPATARRSAPSAAAPGGSDRCSPGPTGAGPLRAEPAVYRAGPAAYCLGLRHQGPEPEP
ncbi:MAG: hypothetical protein ACYSUF_05615 [Planctomycetota bacterium]